MQPLTVPAPELVLDPPSGPPEIEKPVIVRLPAVRYPDAQEVAAEDVRTLGTLVYRGVVGSEEVWDERKQMWITAPSDADGLATLTPLPMSPAPGEPSPWRGVFVAVGQKDKAGNARFMKAVSGTPAYRLRAFAHVVRNGVAHRGVGSPSPDLQFISAADNVRFAATFDTGNATTAGQVRLFLKSGSSQTAGYLEIRATPSQELEIANCATSGAVLAKVTLSAGGDIHLTPGPSGKIILDGPLEAQLISYVEAVGGARQTL